MLLETVLFLNPNRGFFSKGYYTNIIFTKQQGHGLKPPFLWNMKSAVCVTFLSNLPLKFFSTQPVKILLRGVYWLTCHVTPAWQ